MSGRFLLVYNPRMRKLRLALAVVILFVSLAILAWGLWPAVHESRSLRVPSGEMTLPTPSSFEPDLGAAPRLGYAPLVVSWQAAGRVSSA